MITDKLSVVIPTDDPSPIGYINLFEKGDIWIKIKGCEECPEEWRLQCCGNCPMVSSKGCFWHQEERKDGGNKPFHCIINPLPNVCKKNCVLEFRCIKGKNKGKTRRVKDIRNELT